MFSEFKLKIKKAYQILCGQDTSKIHKVCTSISDIASDMCPPTSSGDGLTYSLEQVLSRESALRSICEDLEMLLD